MKAVGIVAEYNPLHNGHVYQSRSAERIICGTSFVDSKEMECSEQERPAAVCFMSGDFVQRGAPAIMNKWYRAEAALSENIDLVIEIPVCHCLADAGVYASSAVALMKSLGVVEWISFGSESGDEDAIREVAEELILHADEIKARISDSDMKGMNYPSARESAYKDICSPNQKKLEILRNPNDILALEYMKSIISEKGKNEIKPIVIKRIGAGHNCGTLSDEYMSAAGIRKLLSQGKDVSRFIPASSMKMLEMTACKSAERWFDLMRYSILTASTDSIAECPSGGDGAAERLKKSLPYATSAEDLVRLVKTKNVTETRINRLIMQRVVGIDRKEACESPKYLRVLGFNSRGRKLISEIKSKKLNTLPLLTNINREINDIDGDAKAMLELDIRAADIYEMINSPAGSRMYDNSDKIKKPIMIL